jgi:hypothetical protein
MNLAQLCSAEKLDRIEMDSGLQSQTLLHCFVALSLSPMTFPGTHTFWNAPAARGCNELAQEQNASHRKKRGRNQKKMERTNLRKN